MEADRERSKVQAAQAQASSANARTKALEAQLAELKAKQTNRGLVLTLGDVLFDTGHAELQPGADSTLDQLVQFMTQNPERTLKIEGYTDSVGSDSSNQVLSERRAIAVKNALIDRGLDASRISARGYGEASPVASNGTSGGRQQNRRVEIVISSAKS
jgi:outer membrane protein OmpA-like peptidoglycan-associated protein